MIDHPGDDDAGETSAVKSKNPTTFASHGIKILLHTKHVVTLHTAIGAVLVLVAPGGRALTNDSGKRREMTVSTPREALRFGW